MRRRGFNRSFSKEPGVRDFSYQKTYVFSYRREWEEPLRVAWNVFYKDELIDTVDTLAEVRALVREKLIT